MAAVRRNPEIINEPNVFGQTPLHFSVHWPTGMQLLLEADSLVDATDNQGDTPIIYAAKLLLQEPFNILAEKQCVLHRFPGYSILEDLMITEFYGSYNRVRRDATRRDMEAMVDATIRLVAERRKILETLVRTSLDPQVAKRLRISPEAVLDHNASLAISLLREKIDVPASLDNLWPSDRTVYHTPYLNLRQARTFWNAGFHDTVEFNRLGQTALMTYSYSHFGPAPNGLNETMELVEWLVGKGADLHCRQKHEFRKRMTNNCHSTSDRGYCKSDGVSSTTALHYLAYHIGSKLYSDLGVDLDTENLFSQIIAHSETSERIIKTVLTDILPDSCSCACSIKGCRAYTMLIKTPTRDARKSISPWHFRPVRRAVFYMTQVLAQLLSINQPSFAWLRREMIRFNTFEKLKLRHTCCMMGDLDSENEVIVVPYDDEEALEIKEEQKEQLEKLESLLVEFEDKYNQSGSSFIEFLGGYWEDRMAEVSREEVPIDQNALGNLGVTLRSTVYASSLSSEDGVEEVEGSSDSDDVRE